MGDHKHIYEKVSDVIAQCACGKKKYIAKVKPYFEPVDIEVLWNESFKLPSKSYRVLFYILYLTAGRINEVLRLRKKDLEIHQRLNKKVVLVNLLNLKNRKRKYKLLPIVVDTPIVSDMLDEILEYLEIFKEEEYLFKGMYDRMVEMVFYNNIKLKSRAHFSHGIVDKYEFRLFPHYLRHCRLTHLRNVRRYDLDDLMGYAGWSDLRPASTYVFSSWKDMAERDIKRNVDE